MNTNAVEVLVFTGFLVAFTRLVGRLARVVQTLLLVQEEAM